MNVPASELTAFLEEYARLTCNDQTVLRVDHFCRPNDQEWLTVLLTEQNGKQFLTDAKGRVLCGYDRIAPLFVSSPVKISADVRDLLEQLSDLRNRLGIAVYENAKAALENLTEPPHPFAQAYLVVQAGALGIVDPQGQVIVPAQYGSVKPFALISPGEAGLFLCQRSGHQLNSMDVFDLKGNCIFRQISSLFPREETVLTPTGTGTPLRKVKSLWVVRQSVDRPFPDDPDFQLVREEPRRYALKELRRADCDELRLTAMEDRPIWRYCPVEMTPPKDVLLPLATVIAEAIGCSAQEVLLRLPDYRSFCLERLPFSVRLANVKADTPLDQLGLSIRAHHCLIRNGLQTTGDLMNLSEEAMQNLRRSTPEIQQEIALLRSHLKELSLSCPTRQITV